MIRNIIFDWSGTLSDDFTPLYDIVMELFDEHGVKRVSREEFLRSYTLPYMAHLRTFFDISKERWDELFREKWEQKGFPRVYPGVIETLQQLKAKGVRMALLTSHPERFLLREMESYFGKLEFFSGIFADAYDKRESIHPLLQKMGFNPSETLFVGDTVHDIEAGKHAGVFTAAVLSGYNSEDALRNAGPDFIIADIGELKTIVDKAKYTSGI